MRVQYFIAMTALLCTAVGCAPASAPKQNAGERIGAYLGSWAGYLPGEWEEGKAAPSTLSETHRGTQIWAAAHQGSIEVMGRLAMTEEDSGIVGDLFAKLPTSTDSTGTSGSTSSTSLSTTPAAGSGTLASAPAAGSGTLASSPSVGSGSTLSSSPAAGSGASVSITPGVFGASYAASGAAFVSTSSFSSAFCSYLDSFIAYLNRCVPEMGAGLATISSGCSSMVDALLATNEAIGTSVPSSLVQALNCIGNNVESASCAATDGDIVTPLQQAFEACGITFEGDSI